MSNLVRTNQQALISFDDTKRALIRNTVAKSLNSMEFDMFMAVALSRGLDPLQRQLYAFKNGSSVAFITGIDGFRLIAARTGEYAGQDDPVIEYKNDKLDRVKVTVHRLVQGNRVAFSASAKWDEYAQTNKPTWQKMPETMLEKCAEAKALRKAFPGDLGDLYAPEEMDQADRPAMKTVEQIKEANERFEEPKNETGLGEQLTVVQVDVKDVELRKRVKDLGFQWNKDMKAWTKPYSADEAAEYEFSFEVIEI